MNLVARTCITLLQNQYLFQKNHFNHDIKASNLIYFYFYFYFLNDLQVICANVLESPYFQVTFEEMEACREKKTHRDDPMKYFLQHLTQNVLLKCTFYSSTHPSSSLRLSLFCLSVGCCNFIFLLTLVSGLTCAYLD